MHQLQTRALKASIRFIAILAFLLQGGCISYTVDPPLTGHIPPLPPDQSTVQVVEERYRLYRDRLSNFMVPGQGDGRSLVAHQVVTGKGGNIGWWADSMVVHGWYLAVLGTEHKLAHSNEQAGIAKDIGFALDAIDRLDLKAEPFLSDDKVAKDLNGFFIRDDVGTNILQELKGEWPLDEVRSDWMLELQLKDRKSAMSQDQLISLLFGLAMVNKFCLDPEIQKRTKDIFRRAYAQVSTNDWLLYLPRVPGEDRKKVPRGPSAKGLSYAVERLAKDVLGEPLPGRECVPYSRLVFKWARTAQIPKSYNQSMVLTLGAMTNVWKKDAQDVMKQYKRVLYPLLHAVYHDTSDKTKLAYTQEAFLRHMMIAPDEGPGSNGRGGWSAWNRFYSPPIQHKDWQFAGLDYMLLHNLYFIRYPTQ